MGQEPVWPRGQGGEKIFVYLKPFRNLRLLLSTLTDLGTPTIAFIERLTPKALFNERQLQEAEGAPAGTYGSHSVNPQTEH